MRKIIQLLGALVVGCLGFGCASSAPSGPSAEIPRRSTTTGTADLDAAIRRGDTLNVKVAGITPEINEAQEVNEFGMITLPYIKDIKAENLTPGILAKKIERAYIDGGYYTKLSVSVICGPREFYIHGEVRSPGKALWTTGLTLVKAIALSGGFSDYANKSDIEVRRRDKVFRINYKQAEKDPSLDIEIYPRDDIKVGRTIF